MDTISISYIKNIIKLQKKFNYDSIPDIYNFADCHDAKLITPLAFYCYKQNENRTLEILENPDCLIFESKHPLLDATYNFMKKTCNLMIQKNIIPKNKELLDMCFNNCLSSEMEEIAILLLPYMNLESLKELYSNGKYINPVECSKKYHLKKLYSELLTILPTQ